MSVVVFVCVCVCMCVFACLKQKDMVQCLSGLLSSSASTFPSRWLLKVIADVSIGLILMGRPSLSSFTQFCILVCIYLHKWGTYASYLYPVIFDLCGVFDHLLIPFWVFVSFFSLRPTSWWLLLLDSILVTIFFRLCCIFELRLQIQGFLDTKSVTQPLNHWIVSPQSPDKDEWPKDGRRWDKFSWAI